MYTNKPFWLSISLTYLHKLFSEKLSSLFIEAGFTEERNDYVERTTENIKENLNVKRVYVQAKFVKRWKENSDKKSSDWQFHRLF